MTGLGEISRRVRLGLIERLRLQQRMRELVELPAMLYEQRGCFVVRFIDDAAHLGVDEPQRLGRCLGAAG